MIITTAWPNDEERPQGEVEFHVHCFENDDFDEVGRYLEFKGVRWEEHDLNSHLSKKNQKIFKFGSTLDDAEKFMKRADEWRIAGTMAPAAAAESMKRTVLHWRFVDARESGLVRENFMSYDYPHFNGRIQNWKLSKRWKK